MPERRHKKPDATRSRPAERAGGPLTAQAADARHLLQLVGNRAAGALLQARVPAPHPAIGHRVPAGRLVQRATWKDYQLDHQVNEVRGRIKFTNNQDVLFPLPEEEKARLASRIEITLYRLELGLAHDWLGLSHDLAAKIGGLLRTKPDKSEIGQSDAAVVAKKISEDLSELEHAADVVLRHGPQDMAVSKVHVGAKGPKEEGDALPHVEKAGIAGFEQEGVLPPIDEPQLQADSYYRSRDGFIHVVEVKDTVNALRTKLVAKDQYLRQVRWLERHKKTPSYKAVVEYFVQDPTPFHRLLDDVVRLPFAEIEKAQLQQNQDWIKFGDEKFTFARFDTLYEDAMRVFLPNIKVHKLKGDGIGKFLDQYFGTKALAKASIADPDIMKGYKG